MVCRAIETDRANQGRVNVLTGNGKVAMCCEVVGLVGDGTLASDLLPKASIYTGLILKGVNLVHP
jgi:hypothetical protein